MTRRRPRSQLTTHVSPELAAEVIQLAATRRVSVSAIVEVLLGEALRVDVEHNHAALLEAAVERTIRVSLSRHLYRLGELSFRAALDSDETRRLVLTLLVKEIGSEQTKQFRREAHSASWQRLKEPLPVPSEHQDGSWPVNQARS
jgi:hypothetical protein